MAIANYQLFIQDAQKVAAETGVPASVTLAQLILESSGKYENNLSSLGANYNNLFGIKGTGTAGSVSLPTWEVVNGKTVQTNANFRVYNNTYESLLDHAKLLLTDRYTKYTNGVTNADEYAKAIHKAGYATDPAYSDKLIKIMNQYDLKTYDTGGHVSIGSIRANVEGGGDVGGASTESVSKEESDTSYASNIYFNITRTLILIGIAILCIVFFFKAFPAVGDVAEKATNVIPQKKALKTVLKGVKK